MIYTEDADYPEQGIFLIAYATAAGEETDTLFLQQLLHTNGERFGVEMFVVADEVRSFLPKSALIPLFVAALDNHDAEGGFDWGTAHEQVFGAYEGAWGESERRELHVPSDRSGSLGGQHTLDDWLQRKLIGGRVDGSDRLMTGVGSIAPKDRIIPWGRVRSTH